MQSVVSLFAKGDEEESEPLRGDNVSTSVTENGNARWKTVLGVLVLLGIGVVALSFNPSTRERLETANNILRRYRCPPGGYPAGRTASGDCLCLRCPIGFLCPGGYRGRVPCPRGTYQDVTGQNTCKPSPAGYHNPGTGASRPVACARGSYQPRSGRWGCIPASPGYFVFGMRGTRQKECPSGTYQNKAGQQSCKKPPPGFFVSGPGSAKPVSCGYGTFNDGSGSKHCTPARPGYYSPRRGEKKAVKCPRNTFQKCYGQMSCIPCPPGMTSEPGSTRCVMKVVQAPPGATVAKVGMKTAAKPAADGVVELETMMDDREDGEM